MLEVRLIDAIQLHKKIMDDAEYDFSKELNLAQCLLYVENAPTIEAVPVRHGQWIPFDGWFNKGIVKCSVCRHTLDMHGVNAGRGDANFCPNCGSKMDEGAE